MSPFQAFQMFMAVKSHFADSSYDYFKYHGKTRVTKDAFLKRSDTYKFEALAALQNPLKRLHTSYIAGITDVHNVMGDRGRKAEEAHNKLMARIAYELPKILHDQFHDHSMSSLKSNGDMPPLLYNIISDDICIEWQVVFNYYFDLVTKWDPTQKNNPLWLDIRNKILKYQPFMEWSKSTTDKIIVDFFINKE